MLERGHRLIADDVVKIRKREESYLEGSVIELTRHHMEIRGIGIINVANLYGAICVRDSKRLDVSVYLEAWDDNHDYDRVGLEERFIEMLNVKVPSYVLPVKPGRDVALLLETIALNHRLKQMGYHSARDFRKSLQTTISEKSARKRMRLKK